MLHELQRHIFVGRIMRRQLQRHLEHVLTEKRHPRGTIRLFEAAARRQFGAAVEYADVVEPEKSALEDVAAGAVFAIHPPGEIKQEFLEALFQPTDVSPA